ncbi:hypothetical protein [Acetobacter lambici]|uniref:hypothetical protein n=1 Tax=Acetobacter lambici TaxID=1332824 RepID=UPI0020A38AA9|nr:hypothetical protein [Acetobacter lambici]MCP1243140.1 hypothetical protein [Acetobacter lambici]
MACAWAMLLHALPYSHLLDTPTKQNGRTPQARPFPITETDRPVRLKPHRPSGMLCFK